MTILTEGRDRSPAGEKGCISESFYTCLVFLVQDDKNRIVSSSCCSTQGAKVGAATVTGSITAITMPM
jgi:hypothetical protein